MRSFWVVASLCLIVVGGQSALAKMPVATLVKATELIKAKKPTEAYDLLKASFDPKDTSPDELFVMGLAAKQAGLVQESVGHFETTLAAAPQAHRVHASNSPIPGCAWVRPRRPRHSS